MCFAFLISTNSFAEMDAKTLMTEINADVVTNLNFATHIVNLAKSGVVINQIEMCSRIEIALNSAHFAESITGLKEIKKISQVDHVGVKTEFLSLQEHQDRKDWKVIETVNLQQLTDTFKEFRGKYCKTGSRKLKDIENKSSDGDCSKSVTDSNQDVLSDKKADQLNDIKNITTTIQK